MTFTQQDLEQPSPSNDQQSFDDMPQNMDLEQALLGNLLVNNDAYDDAVIKPEYFYYEAHKSIFQTIEKYVLQGRNASPVTLKPLFENSPDLQDVGGASYLADLASNSFGHHDIKDKAESLKDLYQRRELIRVAQETIANCRNYDNSVKGGFLSQAERAITKISDQDESRLYTASQAAFEAVQWITDIKTGKIVPISTKFKGLDQILTGLYPGGLYIIAARPGMGKTVLMLNMAENIAQTNPSLVISLEMRAQELGMRLLAKHTGISVNKQRRPHDLNAIEWEELQSAARNLEGLQLTIKDAAKENLSQIISTARKHKRLHGEFTLFIDYLGLIDTDKRIQNKVHQIEELTNSLKALAKELNIPVVLLSQLSRAVESRDDKRPMLSDLRDSGAIEQDADVILFPFRPEYYLQREEPRHKGKDNKERFAERMADHYAALEQAKGQAEIIVAKNRHGESKASHIKFDGERQRFYE